MMDDEEGLTFRIDPNDSDQTRPLQTFLNKHVPSLTSSRKGPWIWIRANHRDTTPQATADDRSAATEEAMEILNNTALGYARIQTDDGIPVRASKLHPTSKKAARDAMYLEAKQEIEMISRKHHITCGKWLLYRSKDNCDGVFRTLAMSMLKGPLSNTGVHCMKIATADSMNGLVHASSQKNQKNQKNQKDQQTFVLCLYLPNIFDKEEAKRVLHVLASDHGVIPSCAKPDIYTYIELEGGHPSQMPPSIWTPQDFFSKAELGRMTDDHWNKKRAGIANVARTVALKRNNDSDSDSDDFAPAILKKARLDVDGESKVTKAVKKEKSRIAVLRESSKKKIEAVVDPDTTEDDYNSEEEKIRFAAVLKKKNEQGRTVSTRKTTRAATTLKKAAVAEDDDATTDDDPPTTANSTTSKLSA